MFFGRILCCRATSAHAECVTSRPSLHIQTHPTSVGGGTGKRRSGVGGHSLVSVRPEHWDYPTMNWCWMLIPTWLTCTFYLFSPHTITNTHWFTKYSSWIYYHLISVSCSNADKIYEIQRNDKNRVQKRYKTWQENVSKTWKHGWYQQKPTVGLRAFLLEAQQNY